jgi:hypothetical protein
MGTFKVKTVATLVSFTGGVTNAVNTDGWETAPGTDSDFINKFNAGGLIYDNFGPGLPGAAGGSAFFGFDQNTPIFELDGNPAVSFNNLPAGFTIDSLVATLLMFMPSVAIIGDNTGQYTFEVFPIAAPQIISSPNNVSFTPFSIALLAPGFTMTPTDFIGLQVKVSFGFTAVQTGTSIVILRVGIGVGFGLPELFEGTYSIQNFNFSIDTEAPVSVGQEITLSSSPRLPNPIDYNKVDTVTVTYTTLDNVVHTTDIPKSAFTAQNQFFIKFIMPDFGDAPKVDISISGTQFSGKVPLGPLLTINFVDGTGIYRLDLSATHDTFYIQDYTPVQTIDAKIPNPTVKTAFVP